MIERPYGYTPCKAWVEPMLDPRRMGGSRRLTRLRDVAITVLLAPVAKS